MYGVGQSPHSEENWDTIETLDVSVNKSRKEIRQR